MSTCKLSKLIVGKEMRKVTFCFLGFKNKDGQYSGEAKWKLILEMI